MRNDSRMGSEASPTGALDSPQKMAQRLMKAVETTQEKDAARECQHMESCGRQLNSRKPTRPVFSFTHPKRIKEEERAACMLLPSAPIPGPKYKVKPFYTPRESWASGRGRVGFGSATRFVDGGLAEAGKRVLTQGASPFSATYPYEEPTIADAEALERHKSVAKKVENLGLSPRKPAVTDADLNSQYTKYNIAPQYQFGTSLVGCRFTEGSTFKKSPQRKSHQPRPNFRLLRDQLPQPPLLRFDGSLSSSTR